MFLKSKFFRVAIALCLVLSITVFTFADTIRLKDGSIIKGKIVSFGEGKFTVLIGEGTRQRQMNFYADEVESIEFDAIPLTSAKTNVPVYNNTSTPRTNDNKTNDNKTNNTIITVGQPNTEQTNNQPSNTNQSNTNKVIIPENVPPKSNTESNTSTTTNPVNTTPPKTENSSKPVVVNVKVLADNTANGWTNSGWVVKKGQKIKITATGRVSLGNGRFSTPSGVNSLPDKDKLKPDEATGGLIAVIGDDNNDFIFVGSGREFVAARDGALFLGINEGNLEDNSGSFEVVVEIYPGREN